MTDDVGWGDLGCYGGGETRGAPTPNLDRMATEGMRFTNYYGQASCTAGRASFITGRIPLRTALSVVLAPGDLNGHQGRRPHRGRGHEEARLPHGAVRQVAPGRPAGHLPHRARLRRDVPHAALLRRGLRLRPPGPPARFPHPQQEDDGHVGEVQPQRMGRQGRAAPGSHQEEVRLRRSGRPPTTSCAPTRSSTSRRTPRTTSPSSCTSAS